ncbi:hypothetical protein evm_008482 [Chilo suppressalis]|nr:hypothetical protein evm_008482 [Chilo suppressalis]
MAPDVATKTSIVTVLAFLLAMVTATTVDIKQEWKPNVGWEITCSWNLFVDDSLQSVALFKNKQQFMMVRPDKHKSLNKKQTWYLVENVMTVECVEDENSRVSGKCVVTVEPQIPPKKDFTFGCDVSGERPYFRRKEKEIFIDNLIPPTDSHMTVTKHESDTASVNCTASGLPVPKIVWTVRDVNVPNTFHGTPFWNATSKMWQVWSSFNPQPEDLAELRCTPEIYKDRQVIRGKSATYSDAAPKITISIGVSLLFVLAVFLR